MYIFKRAFSALLATASVGGFFLLQGCATYTVKVSSISVSDKPKQSFFLFPVGEDITEDDLQFKEFAGQIKRALIYQGFVEAADRQSADTAIAVSYGIGEPKESQYTYQIPVWGKTGYSSSYSYGDVTAYGNVAQYQETKVYTPSYGVTGYATQLATDVTYLRFLKLEAFEVKPLVSKKKLVPVWKTTIRSTGSSGDLRNVFPYMVAASEPYLGRSTTEEISIDIYEYDSNVERIKGKSP